MISVRLDIKSAKLVKRFQKIVDSLEEVTIQKPQESGASDVVIFEVGSDFKKDLEVVESMQRSPSCPEIFIASSFASSEMVMQAVGMGIKELFSEPIKNEEVEIAFARFKEHFESGKPKKVKYGKILSILGSKGGIGSTMIAVNLAEALSRSGDAVSTALVDLNLSFGDIPFFLDVEPAHTIGQISQNISRLDSVYLMSTLTKHTSGIYILAASNNREEAEAVTPDTTKQIFNSMQQMFDYIVVDTNRSLDQVNMVSFECSEVIFIITQLDLPSLKNANRFVNMCIDQGCDESKLKLVINRYEKRSDISLKEAEKVLNQKAFWLIPNDYPSVNSSINQGKSVISTAPNSKVTKSFKEMALRIQGKELLKKPRLWGLFK
jgi:pilus assembly protein CpaE